LIGGTDPAKKINVTLAHMVYNKTTTPGDKMKTQPVLYKIGDTVIVRSGPFTRKIKVTGRRKGSHGFPVLDGYVNNNKHNEVWAYESQIISVTAQNQ